MRRFIRWHLLRRMNTMPPVNEGTFLRSKQTVTVAINFLTWLGRRGLTLGEVTQADLDAWQADGPTTRELVSRFIAWAIKAGLVPHDLTITPHRRGTSPRLGAADQESAVQRVVYSDELSPRDRLAAILVVVFGQQIEDVVRLTWADVTLTGEAATITLGASAMALPTPLDGRTRTSTSGSTCGSRRKTRTSSPARSPPWRPMETSGAPGATAGNLIP